MSREFSAQIRGQVNLFKEYLEKSHGIIMLEKKEIDWGIKYYIEVKNIDGLEHGVVVIYRNKKGVCSYRFEKKISDENQLIFAHAFENRNKFTDNSDRKNNNEGTLVNDKLKYYYETLLPYRDETFDFTIFANELFAQLSEADLNSIRCDFDKLEKIYFSRVKEEE